MRAKAASTSASLSTCRLVRLGEGRICSRSEVKGEHLNSIHHISISRCAPRKECNVRTQTHSLIQTIRKANYGLKKQVHTDHHRFLIFTTARLSAYATKYLTKH